MGLAYRRSMHYEDRDVVGDLLLWNSFVAGELVGQLPGGSGWLLVAGNRFLPMEVDGVPVLRLATSQELSAFQYAVSPEQGETTPGMKPAPQLYLQPTERSAAPLAAQPAPQPEVQAALQPAVSGSGEGPSTEVGGEADGARSGDSPANPSSLRPGAATSEPDAIEFGLMVKRFFGINFKADTFFLDMVLTLRWKDERVKDVVSSDFGVWLPKAAAKAIVWLPDVTVTNRDVHGLEVISSAVTINRDGTVVKVERMFVRVRSTFDISAFPFDAQNLEVKVASTSYMISELKLRPLLQQPGEFQENVTDIDGSFFGDKEFQLLDFGASATQDFDGSLQKSRGIFNFRVKRDHKVYVESIFFPSFLLVAISWTVFFFPLKTAFVMPRVASSSIAVLASVTLAARVDAIVPGRSSLAWIDIFEECTELLMFATIALNITEQYIFCHIEEEGKRPLIGYRPAASSSLGAKDELDCLAQRFGHELQVFFPCLTLVAMSIVFSATDGRQLKRACVAERTVIAVGVLGYILFAFYRVWRASKALRLFPQTLNTGLNGQQRVSR